LLKRPHGIGVGDKRIAFALKHKEAFFVDFFDEF
jgi:hypothetical protein